MCATVMLFPASTASSNLVSSRMRVLTGFACPQAAHEQIIKNLQRENAMIATAWYDLTSRLQSNHVVLQRKDQPKSWLNKQRQMVNGEY